ncbi:MAG: hypothetical protein GX628_03750 [Clostridiales bacterium]|nr:hypothetical protein [Clostridiales bacterium]
MLYTVGYSRIKRDEFMNALRSGCEVPPGTGDRISEVYFSWSGIANGRSSLDLIGELPPWEECARTLGDLREMKASGLKLNLLLNGNCYGRDSASRSFFEKIGELVDSLNSRVGIDSITTSSLFIAKFIRNNFEGMGVRASVNMGIGTSAALRSLDGYFDGFYVKRELNRDLTALRGLAKIASGLGIEMYGLANSGCLCDCPAHTFHDNLVAHEAEIAAMDNAYDFRSVCGDYFSASPSRILCDLSFIRPEDTGLYEGVYPMLKLATRVSPRPAAIISAYLRRSFNGNLPELLEPDHSARLLPYVVDNRSLPADFGEHVSSCGRVCRYGAPCPYGEAAYASAALRLG